jgi:hypothetical protein
MARIRDRVKLWWLGVQLRKAYRRNPELATYHAKKHARFAMLYGADAAMLDNLSFEVEEMLEDIGW